MIRSPKGTLAHAGGLVLILVPFLFAFMRAISTGTDRRFIWMALATFVTAGAVMMLGKTRGTSPQGLLMLFIAALFLAALVGAGTAYLVGATSMAAVALVATGFALCEAGGGALVALARTRKLGADWRTEPRPTA